MSKTIFGWNTEHTVTPSASTVYVPIANSINGSATEANVVFKVKESGTLSLFGVHWNNVGTNRTITLRKNSGNGNEVINDTTGVDAWYYDTTHTDSVALNDTLDVQFTDTGTHPGIYGYRLLFEASSGSPVSLWTGLADESLGADPTIFVQCISGYDFASSAVTEDEVQQRVRASGTHTLSYMQVSVVASAGTTTTARFRKNGANGNSAVTVTASTTGLFLDSTNSDTFTAGDLINYTAATFAGGGADAPVWFIQATVDWGITSYDIAGVGSWDFGTASPTTSYWSIMGGASFNSPITTEALPQIAFKYSGSSLSNARASVLTNTFAASVTWQLRKNNGNANQSFSITNGTTGWFEDTSHSDTFAADDVWDWSIAGGTSGNLYIGTWLITVNNGAATTTPATIYAFSQMSTGFSRRVKSVGY